MSGLSHNRPTDFNLGLYAFTTVESIQDVFAADLPELNGATTPQTGKPAHAD